MLDEVQKAVADDDPEGGFDEVIKDIKGFLPDNNSITNGDVVVLTALTNIVFNENVLSNVGIIMDEPKAPNEGEENYEEKKKEYDKKRIYCSICFPRKPAALDATFCSVSPNFRLSSLVSKITAPITSPSQIIGQII